MPEAGSNDQFPAIDPTEVLVGTSSPDDYQSETGSVAAQRRADPLKIKEAGLFPASFLFFS